MNQLAIDFSAGRSLRDLGTTRTLETEADAWREDALAALRLFAATRPHFTAEAFRYEWLSRGKPGPHSHKVWGALFLSAARAGIIEHTGEYRKASSPGTHAHPVGVWRAAA